MQPEVSAGAGSFPFPSSSPKADLLAAVIPPARTVASATAATSGRILIETDTCFPYLPVSPFRGRETWGRLNCSVEPPSFTSPVISVCQNTRFCKRALHEPNMLLNPSQKSFVRPRDGEVDTCPGEVAPPIYREPGPCGRCPWDRVFDSGGCLKYLRLFGLGRVVV